MHAVKALYKLARPFNALSGALAVIVGGYVAGSSDGSQWLRVLMAALVTFLITASSNAWNDYLDIEIDRINRPDRVLPAGHLLPRTALIFSLTLALLSLLLSAGINAMALMIALASNVLLAAEKHCVVGQFGGGLHFGRNRDLRWCCCECGQPAPDDLVGGCDFGGHS